MLPKDKNHGRSPRRWMAALCAVVLVGVLLLMPVKYPGRWLGVLFDFAHAPVFAILVFVVTRMLGGRDASWKLSAGVAVTAALFGLLGEFMQGSVGRSGGLGDALANGVGAAIGFVAVTWRRWRRFTLAFTIVGLAACTVAVYFHPASMLTDIVRQSSEFPVLASFENELELSRWQVGQGSLARSDDHASDGDSSLKWHLFPGKYPYCLLRWPSEDWTGYTQLEFDVWNDSAEPIELVTKIEDFTHTGEYEDRFHQTDRLPSGMTTIRVDLNQVRTAPESREMDMTLICRVALFTIDLQKPRVLYVDRMRLVGKVPAAE